MADHVLACAVCLEPATVLHEGAPLCDACHAGIAELLEAGTVGDVIVAVAERARRSGRSDR